MENSRLSVREAALLGRKLGSEMPHAQAVACLEALAERVFHRSVEHARGLGHMSSVSLATMKQLIEGIEHLGHIPVAPGTVGDDNGHEQQMC